MKDLFGKCGANCGHCPAYKENAETDATRQRGCDGWFKYLGFRTTPDRMYCDGCQPPDGKNNPVLVNPCCIVRKCAITNGVANCAYCSRYPCEDLGQDVDRERVEARLGSPMPEEDYLAFMEPYEGNKHLGKIRALLKVEDISARAKFLLQKRESLTYPMICLFLRKKPQPLKRFISFLRI